LHVQEFAAGHVFFNERSVVFALRMGDHEMVEDVGGGIRKLAFSDGNSDKAPRLEKSSTGLISQRKYP